MFNFWIHCTLPTLKACNSPYMQDYLKRFIVLCSSEVMFSFLIKLLRLRGTMIGRHFHANMKVQTATCKDNNNSKNRAATWEKFDIYIYKVILADYIPCMLLESASNSKTLNSIRVRRQKSSFRDNVLGRELVGKNGFIVDSISTDNVLWVFYPVLSFVVFSGKYHGKYLPILYAYLNGSH